MWDHIKISSVSHFNELKHNMLLWSRKKIVNNSLYSHHTKYFMGCIVFVLQSVSLLVCPFSCQVLAKVCAQSTG